MDNYPLIVPVTPSYLEHWMDLEILGSFWNGNSVFQIRGGNRDNLGIISHISQ